MGLIVSVIASVLCLVLYIRMYKRDLPDPLPVWKAVLPVIPGLAAPLLSTVLVLLLGAFVGMVLGTSVSAIQNPVLKSVASAFLSAGFPEEIVKLVIFLVVLLITRPKKVYEYGLLCAGVGFGFTVLEEFLYGGGSLITTLFRLPSFGMHMVFGIIMGTYFGLAAYNRQQGSGSVWKYRILGVVLPMLWHTLFDAGTSSNVALNAENDDVVLTGIIVGVVVMVVFTVLHYMVLIQFKKKSADLCAMTIQRQ